MKTKTKTKTELDVVKPTYGTNPEHIPVKKESIGVAVSGRNFFTKEMILRAKDIGIDAFDFLEALAVDDSIIFRDMVPTRVGDGKGGYKIQFEEILRHATLDERVKVAKELLPYIKSRKPVEVAHQGNVNIIHSLASTPLDAIQLDEQGRVIGDDNDDDIIDGDIDNEV